MNNALTKTLTAGLMHGLKVKDMYENKVLYIDYTSQTYDFKHVGLKLCIERNERFKPFLFPMSSLTKEIEFKGERFVPYIELLRICNFDVDNMSDEELNHYKDNCRDIELMMFFEVEKLIEWHFNVFGLSPEEFIEVNETNNPYAV